MIRWYSFIFETEGVFPAPESSQLAIDAFVSGEALIVPGLVMTALKLADMEDGYGIIPYPKWDENQDRYYTMPSDSASILGVLTTADLSDHRIGNIAEDHAQIDRTVSQVTRSEVHFPADGEGFLRVCPPRRVEVEDIAVADINEIPAENVCHGIAVVAVGKIVFVHPGLYGGIDGVSHHWKIR